MTKKWLQYIVIKHYNIVVEFMIYTYTSILLSLTSCMFNLKSIPWFKHTNIQIHYATFLAHALIERGRGALEISILSISHSQKRKGVRTASHSLENIILIISYGKIIKNMHRKSPSPSNTITSIPLYRLKNYVSAQTVENKFSKVRFLPRMSF